MLDALGARGMAIEFNTRFLYRDHSDEEKQRYLAANKRLLRKAQQRGVWIAVGSDAHSPKDQGGAFATALALLDELGINELAFPIAGRLARVALRVERKPEPEPPPAPPPPTTRARQGGEAGPQDRRRRRRKRSHRRFRERGFRLVGGRGIRLGCGREPGPPRRGTREAGAKTRRQACGFRKGCGDRQASDTAPPAEVAQTNPLR